MKLLRYVEAFATKKIVVIGDIMLDKYIFGKVKRISQEAPIPILTVGEERYVSGGAANAASNITTLGAEAFLLGVAGKDPAGKILLTELNAQRINTDYLVFSDNKPTTQKIRAIGNNYQLLRIDYEDRNDISDELPRLIENLNHIKAMDAIIVSDYSKGTITPEVMAAVKAFARKRETLLLVDPKPSHKSYYHDVTLITPNRKEAAEMSGIQIETTADIEAAGQKLMTELNCNVLITRSAKGMSLFKPNDPPVHLPTETREVFDVSGAGDTVIATTALAICSGASLREAAVLANHAAGIKVGKLGTAPVELEALRAKVME